MIPKKIHQIYFDFYNKKFEENKLFIESSNSFKNLNQDYEYKLWNENDCEQLIIDNFPQYYDFYKNMRHKIQKVDFARCVILYVEGGLYADLDMICLKNIDNLITNNLILHNVKEVYPNYSFIENDIMGCQKNSNIFKKIIEEQEENYNLICKKEIYNIWKIRFILQTTGPKYVSRIIKKYLKTYKPFKDLVYTKKHIGEYDINNYYFQDYKSNSWVNSL
jgi:mannosyltransferase OCH1-like enzyme